MNCLIVDDEALARKLLEEYVSKIPELTLAGKCANAIEAKSLLQKSEIDILFLDINMPDLTGIDLLKSLKKKPVTILVTAYAEYALQGYELDVIDYLLKPVAFERFFQAVSKAMDYLNYRNTPVNQETQNVAEQENTLPPPASDYFFVKADYKIIKVKFDEIKYIEGMREYIRIHTLNQKIITLLSMTRVMEIVASHNFARVHRSYIVNIDKIDNIYGNMVTIGDVHIPISKGEREEFIKRINKDGLF